MWSSPLMATACCIFLCYILKVLQQVAPALPESTLFPAKPPDTDLLGSGGRALRSFQDRPESASTGSLCMP